MLAAPPPPALCGSSLVRIPLMAKKKNKRGKAPAGKVGKRTNARQSPAERQADEKAQRSQGPSPPPREQESGQFLVDLAVKMMSPIGRLAATYAVLAALLHKPDAATLAAIVASLTTLFDVYDGLNWRRWEYARHGDVVPLLAGYLLCFLCMAALAVVGFTVHPDSWQGDLTVALFVLIALGRAGIQSAICDRLREHGHTEASPFFGKNVSNRIDGWLDRHVADELASSPNIIKRFAYTVATWIGARPISPIREARRFVATAVAAISLLLLFMVGLAVGEKGVHIVVHAVERTIGGASTSTTSTDAAAAPPTTQTEPEATKPSTSDVSPSVAPAAPAPDLQCSTKPGSGAPEPWANVISRLYLGPELLGTGQPPGTETAGCTGPIHRVRTSHGLFVWTEGTSPVSGATLSIAVGSRYGSAIFLAPAVEPVMALIKRFGIVGGSRRFDAGTGDFYPVHTPAGTFILIRREKGTGRSAGSYAIIPPAVAEAWVTAQAEVGEFLWPVPAYRGTEPVFDFDTDTIPSSVAYVLPAMSNNVSEPTISAGELQAVAERAG